MSSAASATQQENQSILLTGAETLILSLSLSLYKEETAVSSFSVYHNVVYARCIVVDRLGLITLIIKCEK